MNICLVRPATVTTMEGFGDDTVPPLGIAYLAGTMESLGHRVCVVDGTGEALERYEPIADNPGALRYGLSDGEILDRIPAGTELIGVTCMFSLEWLTTRTLLNRIRARFPGARIVCGGEHITALPEVALNTCPAIDLCVLGEGEQALADVVAAITAGDDLNAVPGLCLRGPVGPVRTGKRPRMRELGAIPRPAWHLIPIDQYLDKGVMGGINFGRSMPILASRGCPYRCTFCSNSSMWGSTWYARPPGDVVSEMKDYMARYRATNFDFNDHTAIVNREWIVEFCRKIIDEKLKITWQFPSGTRTDVVDAEVARLLFQAGCACITYAPESGSVEMLGRIKKQVTPARMLASARHAVRNGLQVKVSFVLGFPDERFRHILESYWAIFRLAITGIEDVSVFPFSAYPGSEVFRMLVKRGEIVVNDDYFRSLVRGIAALPAPDSPCYSGHYSVRMLRWYCLAGMGLFYGISFVLRPWRLFRLVWNLLRGVQTTRLERALANILNRRAMVLRDGSTAHAGPER